MGARHTGRKLAMQMLYQAELREDPIQDAGDMYLEDGKFSDGAKEWARELAFNAWKEREKTDELIKKYAVDWELDRIAPIDKSILRIGFYELRHTDTAPAVVLNEAIEIAKRYSTDDSPKFINGILGNYVKEKDAN